MYFFVIIINLIFSRNKENIANEKLQTLKSLGASIAHELRTPLRAITSNINGIKKYLPDLITSYQAASKAQLTIPYISPIHYNALVTACNSANAEAQSAFTVIEMLLVKVNQLNVRSVEIAPCSIVNCVDEALQRYPFNTGEKELIHWNSTLDFDFKGDKSLMIHVLFNLLKNALYYVAAAGKGHIEIWIEVKHPYNILHFKDTGSGISAKDLPHIFDHFYTKTQHGSGIGLAFCKLVMQSIGGIITCHSKKGEYTEFMMFFPVVRKD